MFTDFLWIFMNLQGIHALIYNNSSLMCMILHLIHNYLKYADINFYHVFRSLWPDPNLILCGNVENS